MDYTATIEVDSPSEAVWALVGQPSSWTEWNDELADVRVEGDGALQQGSVVHYRWRGREVTVDVTDYEEGRRLAIHSSQGSYEFREGFLLQPAGDRTTVTKTMGFTPTAWWARALAFGLVPLKSLVLGRPLKRELRTLRDAVAAREAQTD